MKMSRLFCLVTGVGIALFGFFLVIGREFYFRGTKVDFGDANILVGWIFVILGLVILVIAIRTKAKDFEEKFMICPKCKEPFNKKDIPDQRCPQCKAEVEDLDGFYERHPELGVGKNK
jgi:hypothetical protein